MTQRVYLQGLKPDRVMEIVRVLRARGLAQGRDFDFAYMQLNRITEFVFYRGKYATLFALEYSEHIH